MVTLNCTGSTVYLRINYTATSVTATVVSVTPPINITLPTVAGQATEGQTLSASHGSWSTLPTSYAYQWQDCNSLGASCTDIAGATNAWYLLRASDVGHTIRVQESASNAAGTSSPATSAATAVVTAPASGGGGGTGSGGGGTSGSGGSAPPAQIASDLLRMLTPGAHVARIGQVAGASGYTYSFTARRTGTLVIAWSYLAKVAHHKPVRLLVATIRVTFVKTGNYRVTVRLTRAGKRLLRKAKRIRLTATATFTSAGLRPIVLHETFTLVR